MQLCTRGGCAFSNVLFSISFAEIVFGVHVPKKPLLKGFLLLKSVYHPKHFITDSPKLLFWTKLCHFQIFSWISKKNWHVVPAVRNCYLFTSFPQLSVWSLTNCLVSHFRGLFKKSPLTGFECRHKLPFFPYLGGKCWFACSKSSHNRKISKFKFLFWVRVFKDFSHLVIKRDTEWGVFFSPYFGEKCWFAFSKSSHER